VPAPEVRTHVSEPGFSRHHPAGRSGFARGGGSEGCRRRHALEHEGPGLIQAGRLLHSCQINNTLKHSVYSFDCVDGGGREAILPCRPRRRRSCYRCFCTFGLKGAPLGGLTTPSATIPCSPVHPEEEKISMSEAS
jgi:hypothetical protein